jgi:shikimate dehydrogenase
MDLIYSPEETIFLQRCKEKGAQVVNGLNMLQYQAEAAWEIFKDESRFPVE